MNVALGEAQRRAGADSSTIGLARDQSDLAGDVRRFELPGARAFCTALQRSGGFAFVHACGEETLLLENLLATGADCLELDPGTNAEICKRAVQGRASVLGMIDPAQVMRFGTPETVRRQAKPDAGHNGPRRRIYYRPGLRVARGYAGGERAWRSWSALRREGVYDGEGRPGAKAG